MDRYYGKIKDNIKTNVNSYNISLELYNELFTKQNGCCAICNKHQSDLPRGLIIDHDHKTEKVRGLLCYSCNSSLGGIKDDIEIAKSRLNIINKKVFLYKQMIEYLRLHPSELSDNDAKEIYKIRMERKRNNKDKNSSIVKTNNEK